MPGRRFTRAAGMGAAAILIATFTSGVPAQADPRPGPTTGPPPNTPPASDAVRARESIDYLMTTYHISQDEALRRLRLQARAAGIVDRVRGAVGDELLDFYLDQRSGGRLTFLTSKPEAAAKSLGLVSTDLGETRFVRSKHTAAQLAQARAEVAKKVAGKPAVQVWTDTATETVKVRYLGTDRKVAAQVRSSAGKVAKGNVAVAVDTPGPPKGVQRACALLDCDTPIRGGVRMHVRRDNGTWGSCTVGFTIRGSNGWSYLMTAGHCVTVPGPKRQYMFHNGLPLVWEKAADGYDEHDPNAPADDRYFINQPTGLFRDYALVPFQTDGMNWSGYWLNNRGAHNLVASSCVSPSNNACSGNTYAMQGVYRWQDMGRYFVVCATGTGTGVIYSQDVGYRYGTHCGEINSTMMTNYSGAGVDGHGIQVNICSRDGDSGGPLFSQIDSTAYGILSGGPPGSGACGTGEYSVYSPVELDLIHAQSRTGITFHVITTANG